MSVVMYGNTYPGCSLPFHVADSISLGYYSNTTTITGLRTKFVVALSSDNRSSTMEITFISAPHNLYAYVTFLATDPVRSMGVILGVISMISEDLSYHLVFMSKAPFQSICYSLNHSI